MATLNAILAMLLEDEEPSADSIYSEAYTLGFDALVDAGVDRETAGRVAQEIAQGMAQP